MKKYWTLFKISFQQEFVYPMNFIMWRVRNIMQLVLLFSLWDVVLPTNSSQILGYSRSMILTYVLLSLLLKSLVLSSRSADISGEIAQGNLVSYLVKPVSYLKYWFSRDLSNKALNILFGFLEFSVLLLILNPPIFLQTNMGLWVLFLVSLVSSIVMFFFLIVLFGAFTFIYPENSWGAIFILGMLTEFLGGGLFPIDVLPKYIQNIILLTPFPYLIFTPMQIYLGKYNYSTNLKFTAVSIAWSVVLFLVVNFIWRSGIKKYRAEGK